MLGDDVRGQPVQEGGARERHMGQTLQQGQLEKVDEAVGSGWEVIDQPGM